MNYNFTFINSINYEDFRRWFNARFSLSLDGKFVGLGRVLNIRPYDFNRLFRLFVFKIWNILNRSINGYLCRQKVLCFRFIGHTIKLYDR